MNKIIIIGGGGHAGITYDCILSQKKYQPIGYIDNKKGNLNNFGLDYFGKLMNIKNLLNNFDNLFFIIGIGDNYTRYKIVNFLKKQKINVKWATVIHPSASISTKIKIGEGSLILNSSIISFNSVIKKHVCINTGASIDHDNIFENFASAGPASVTGGGVKVGELSYLAINSSIKHNINIGKNVIIGANSYVNNNCKSNRLYYGIPAKEIRRRNIGDNYL